MRKDNENYRGIYSELLQKFDSKDIRDTSNLGPSRRYVKRPMIVNHKVKSLSRTILDPLKERNDTIIQGSVKPIGYYSKRRDDVAWIEPKVYEPIENKPGKAPRKVIIERKKKEFSAYNVHEELSLLDINFDIPNNSKEAKLPLEPFDDNQFESRTPEDWIELASIDGNVKGICAKAVRFDENKLGRHESCFVHGYNKQTEEYVIEFESDKHRLNIHKLYVVFMAEDQRVYAKRVANAFEQRRKAYNLILYNVYIDKMPVVGLPVLAEIQQKRIYDLLKSKKLPYPESDKLSLTSMQQLLHNYCRTFNKMTFDRYMPEAGVNILSKKFEMPQNENRKEVPYYGKVKTSLQLQKFQDNYSNFCFKTLYIKQEVIHAMTLIKKQCDHLAYDEHIFKMDFNRTYRLEDFKQIQKTNINAMKNQLSYKWIMSIEEIICENIMLIGKGWFNMKETNKETYEFSKLKKFLTIIKYMMQDSLYQLAFRSMNSFVQAFESKIPKFIKIESSIEVINEYGGLEEEEVEGLFNIELFENTQTCQFQYNLNLNEIVDVVKDIFENGVSVLGEVDQVERRLLKELFKTSAHSSKLRVPYFAPERPKENPGGIPDENLWLWQCLEKLIALIQKSIEPLKTYLDIMQQFSKEIKLYPEQFFENAYGPLHRLVTNTREEEEKNEDATLDYDLEEIKMRIASQIERERNLSELIPDQIKVGIYIISCREVKKNMIEKHRTIIENLKTLIYNIIKYKNNEIRKYKDKVTKTLLQVPKDIRELFDIKKYMEDLPAITTNLSVMIHQSSELYKVLDSYLFNFKEEDLSEKFYLDTYAKNIYDLRDKKDIELDTKKKIFLESLKEEQQHFEQEIKSLQENIDKLSKYQDVEKFEDYAANITDLDKLIKICYERAQDYNEQESLFQIHMINYNIKDIVKQFEVYYTMWITTKSWKNNYDKWMTCRWDLLSGEEVEKEVLAYKVSFNKVKKIFRQNEEMVPLIASIDKFLEDIIKFEKFVPLAVNLRVEGMTERHWDLLSQSVNVRVTPREKNFNLKRVIELNLLEKIEIIEDISVRAVKEFVIRQELDRMYKEWKNMEYDFAILKNTTDIFIVKNFEDCININDEHIGVATNLYYSPYRAYFEDEIIRWKSCLEVVSEVLEKWMKLQMSYMYLQPIFMSGDIKKSLQQYYKMFKQVDNRWKQNMGHARKISNVLEFSNNESLRDNMSEDIVILEKVQKNLENYLTMKRSNFSRLYFLSDDELLKILSNTKDPRNINDYLKKIFENIETLIFNDQTVITHMTSKEGEYIPFLETVDPKEFSVEIWCKSVENQMIATVKDSLTDSIEKYRVMKRTEWVKHMYSQCVLTSTQIFFAMEAEQAIQDRKLAKYSKKCNAQILDLVELVRTPLTTLEKTKISPLIVQGVHEREIIHKLDESRINNTMEFEWVMYLRFYLEEGNIVSRCMQTLYPYGYEYMGNADRLVITPLTDKCYMTLMNAIKLNLGGAPSGPAGTGKTETTKDLSKNLAKLCKVFNCGPEMEYKMAGTFFKGLASCGAWCCFDEFNRISLEVLSVIAQYLQTLLNEKAKNDSDNTTYFLETEIRVLDTFSVFITMNPTYKGRQSLPDNLKALFRPCAMMVPDYKLIAEIFLYAYGFIDSTILAGKMVDTFTLCSEQLSKQQHYDYGMRAVRSTINSAGSLKREKKDMDESAIVLKALVDINMPKFLSHDIPLFTNIITDLFPTSSRKKYQSGILETTISETITKMDLDNTNNFYEKVLQLKDTMLVRHGLMLVGPTGSGKTSNYKVLQAAYNKVGVPENSTEDERKENPYRKVNVRIMNPRSITNEQIYGQMNQVTKEYTKGLVPVIFNKAVDESKTYVKQWIMFDSPVDSYWIESMNSVLDDSKKLCLANSEIIDMSDEMHILFETDDLSEASPATISRCGMIYMDSKALESISLFKRFSKFFPTALKETSFVKRIKLMYEQTIDKALFRLRRECKQYVLTSENNYCTSLFKIINSLIVGAKENEYGDTNSSQVDCIESCSELIYMFALTWSVGSNIDDVSRSKFDKILKELTKDANSILFSEGMNTIPMIDLSKTYYDYYVDIHNKKFELWNAEKTQFEFNYKLSYDELIVPTDESYKMTGISKLLMGSDINILKCGGTGTGKTLNCDNLLRALPHSKFVTFSTTFNARTSIQTIHNLVTVKLKRRKMGVLGPENNKKGLVFVDDLNMPRKEYFGSQPVLELLRQWFDHGGFYDMAEFEFKKVIEVYFLTAMGLPGGARSIISPRLVRHFNIIGYINISEISIADIYFSIISGYYNSLSMPAEVTESLKVIVDSTISCFKQIETQFLPIPQKTHYLFNLRDMSKVFQGLSIVVSKNVNNINSFVRLWSHEMSRVFRDRLICQSDIDDYNAIIKECVNEKIKIDYDEFVGTKIYFCEFIEKDQDGRLYREIEDLNKITVALEEFLEDYNNENLAMNLILFSDAVEHIVRLCRILSLQRGNALLMGVGGSGRQSTTKLANYTMNYKLFEIEITKEYRVDKNWKEDVRQCLMHAGARRNHTTFLILDTQIIEDKILEDINNILNTADVPNIYNPDDMEDINKPARRDCQDKGLEQTPLNLFNQFLNAIKKNIHVVLAMSPMDEKFRSNLRNFPSLNNCTTIDYYSEWPVEALTSVARVQVNSQNLELFEYKDGVINMFSNLHKSVEEISIRYKEEYKRYNYVTPTSYLELIRMYHQVLISKRDEFERSINRFEIGLKIIENAQCKVVELQKKIKEEEPKLQDLEIQLTKQNETLRVILEETNKKREEVLIASKEQNFKVEMLEKMNEEIRREKVDTEREKDEALKLADKLNAKDITEVSSYLNPPDQISYCMKLIVLLFDEEKDVKNKDELPQWFQVCKYKLLRNVNELKEKLKTRLREEKISDKQFKKIDPFYDKSKFETNFYESISGACVKLAGWVKAMRSIYITNVKLAPILEKLTDGEQKLAEGQALLDKLNQEKDELESKCGKLQNEVEECQKKKEETQMNLELNKLRLVRANKLLSGLKDEKSRWFEEVKRLKHEGKYLIGNCIIAAGMMSYGGPFDSIYRNKLLDTWVSQIKELNILIFDKVGLIPIVGNKVIIENWKAMYKLPDDELSIENGIILEYTKRWPLCIDPQGQAGSFIKKQGFDTKKDLFKVLKASDEKLNSEVEISIKFGKWLIIEGLSERISPDLYPILTPQIKIKGKNKALKYGDKEIDYMDDFRLFLITSLPNPHYSPETCVKICLINFAITETGLKDQMLSLAVSLEKYELEAERNKLIENNAQNEKKLEEKEDEILEDLKKSNPERILDEDDLINKLYNTKEEANRIKKDQESAKEREDKIHQERNKYTELSMKTAILFFALIDMVNIDHMYQYSLLWYKDLFQKASEDADQNPEDDIRIGNIYSTFLKKLYDEVCRTLFEKDKLLFSFNITLKLKIYHGEVDPEHFRYLLTGNTKDIEPSNPPSFIDKLTWSRIYITIYGIGGLKCFDGFKEYFFDNIDKFKKIYMADDPGKIPFPGTWNQSLDKFQKLLVYKALRPDYLTIAVKEYIKTSLGKHFIEPPLFKIDEGYINSTKETPIIFILTPGSDPLADLRRFAEKKLGKDLRQLSLGQGQGKQAVAMYKKFSEDGTWLLYQNTHLYPSWMSTLEKLVEDLKKVDVHPEFRLFLTTGSTTDFPVSILQDGIKMTVENSGDVKQMLLNAYSNYTDEYLDTCRNPDVFKTLVFGMTLFHTLIVERKKFGPIGWNSGDTYDFSIEDLKVTIDQLWLMLEENDEMQYKVIKFCASTINYGGRVTDDKDERLIQTFVERFINHKMNEGSVYFFDDSKKYLCPPVGVQEDYKEFIMVNYDSVTPEIFGLHTNADIMTNETKSENLLSSILSVQPQTISSNNAKTYEDILEEKADFILGKIPERFDEEMIMKKYNTSYEESMNTVLTQEVQRYNNLIEKMVIDLEDFKNANRGRILMNDHLEKMGLTMWNNEIPDSWTEEKGIGFLSIKPLSNWINDLQSRVEFLKDWELDGTPSSFWMSGFFFPHAFLTGIKQNYARKYKIPIDLIDFDFELLNDKLDHSEITEKPVEGCYIYGLYIEGATYDNKQGILVASKPRVLYNKLPILWLKPNDSVDPKSGVYKCPIYKTPMRYGVLSTTGHSTNFVMYIDIPTEQEQDRWILAGVASLLSLKYE